MKRTWALLLCAAMLFSCLAGCGKKEEVVDHTVKIGLFEPMSGDQALYGNWERLGVEYARTVRQSAVVDGVPHTVELVEKDTCSRIDGSVYAARALAEEGVSIALGTYGSSECSVAAPALEEAGISVIGITCTDPTVTSGHANYYRVCYTDEYQAMLLADYAYEYGARVAYCLAQTDRDYDRAMCNAFIKEFQALGGSVITTILYTALSMLSSAVLGAIASSGLAVTIVLLAVGAALLALFKWKSRKKRYAMIGAICFALGVFGLLQATGVLSGVPILALGIPAVLSCYFDIFSGFVQAYVFTLLTMVYIGNSCPAPEESKAEQ